MKFKLGDKVKLKGGQDVWIVSGYRKDMIELLLKNNIIDDLYIEVFESRLEMVESSKKLVKKKMYAPIAGYKDNSGAFIAGAIFDSKAEALSCQGFAWSEPIGVQEIEVEVYV